MSTVGRNNKRSAEVRKTSVIVNKKIDSEKSKRNETKLRLRTTPLSNDLSNQCSALNVGGKSKAHNRLKPLSSRSGTGVECKTKRTTVEATQLEKRQCSPFLPGARCGEIFVANNARQWTFICTFCNKSTRDIGDFIYHIKKHLEVSHFPPESYYDYGELDYEDDFGPSDQDYLDCGNYLDVSVHSEPDEINYNGQEPYAKKSTAGRQPKAPQATDVGFKQHADESLQRHTRKGDNVMNYQDDDDEEHENEDEEAETIKKTAMRQHSVRVKEEEGLKDMSNDGDMSTDQRIDDNNATDFTDRHFLFLADNQNGVAGQNGHDDDDFDNQLLITPDDAFDASSIKNIPVKRRQIRGTAYCAICNKTFQYYSLYRNHMIKHSNETPFKCSVCKKGFKSKQAIRYHMNTHQKEKQFNCFLCHAGYYTENQFITHMLTHTDNTTFPCMVCGEIFPSEKDCNVHLSTHMKERPFRCEFCNKLFRLRHHLSNHVKMHRQYRCDFCKEEFTSVVHQRKPYACPECECNPDVKTSSPTICAGSERIVPKSVGRSGIGAGAAEHESDVKPLQIFETAQLLSQRPTECVDLAEMVSDSDDQGLVDGDGTDESLTAYAARRRDGSVYVPPIANSKKRYSCKYCSRTYSHLGGLNYHIRMKHSN